MIADHLRGLRNARTLLTLIQATADARSFANSMESIDRLRRAIAMAANEAREELRVSKGDFTAEQRRGIQSAARLVDGIFEAADTLSFAARTPVVEARRKAISAAAQQALYGLELGFDYMWVPVTPRRLDGTPIRRGVARR